VTAQPGGQSIVTPGLLALTRKHQHALLIEKSGYQKSTVDLESHTSAGLLRNLVWLHPVGWLIGLIVDLSNGSGYNLEPEKVSVSLAPDTGPQSNVESPPNR